MLIRREASISILLISFLLSEFTCHRVARWRLRDEKCMKMRLRRVLGELVTLGLPKGQLSEMVKEREVDKLLAITKFALFSQEGQLKTRRNDLSWWNPGAWFGENPGVALGGSIGAGVIASNQGFWAGLGGGIGPVTVKSNWKNETQWQGSGGQPPSAIGIGDIDDNPIGFTEPMDDFFWTFTWPDLPESGGVTTFPWLLPDVLNADTNTHTTKDPKWDLGVGGAPPWSAGPGDPPYWDLGPTTKPHWDAWQTTKPIWDFGSTTQPQWDFRPTTQPQWDFGPTTNPAWDFGPTTNPAWDFAFTTEPQWDFGFTTKPRWDFAFTTKPQWDFGFTTKPQWDFGFTTKPQWDFGPHKGLVSNSRSTNRPNALHNSTVNEGWFFGPTTNRSWLLAPKTDKNSLIKATAQGNSNIGNGTTRIPASKPGSHFLSQPTTKNNSTAFTKTIPPWRRPGATTAKASGQSPLESATKGNGISTKLVPPWRRPKNTTNPKV